MSQELISILCIVFYINKMFIRLNKVKILRSASCLLFQFIVEKCIAMYAEVVIRNSFAFAIFDSLNFPFKKKWSKFNNMRYSKCCWSLVLCPGPCMVPPIPLLPSIKKLPLLQLVFARKSTAMIDIKKAHACFLQSLFCTLARR